MAVALSLASSVALGCGGSSAARPTETVRVMGPASDALGRTLELDGHGLVRVELHEGPVVWVRAAEVAPAALVPGASLVITDASGTLVVGSLVEVADRVLTVALASGERQLVPLGRVLAVLHAGASEGVIATDTPPPPPPPPPPPDVRRFATRPTGIELLERVRIVSCDAGGARVLGASGTLVTLPLRDLRPFRVQAGDRVHALWENGETAYAATVLALEGRLARVHYEDGSEEWVRPEQIVRQEIAEGTRAGAGACPARGADSAMVRRGAMRRVVEVISCSGNSVTARAPGTEIPESIPLAELRELVVPAASRVEVFWQESAPYVAFSGATHDGRVDVRYDDGSEEAALLTNVRWIASDFAAEPYLCPR